MRRMFVLLAASVLLLAACGGDESEPAAGGGEEATQDAPAQEGPDTVAVATSDLGEILVDADGNTLYMFVPDMDEGKPTCYDDCAEAWPPLEATVELTAGEGAEGSLLGTAQRTDGSEQVTYNGLPLYLFSGDAAAGDTNGQGLNDVWWVMSPEGEPIEEAQEDANAEPYGKG